MANITVIGLGIIGTIWAGHYAQAGHSVRTWNRTPKPEVDGFTQDLIEAVNNADMIHICVADPAAVQSVLDVIKQSLTPVTLVIQSSTISPQAATSFEQQVTATGAGYVESPFTGSKPAAEAREVVFFQGGSQKAIELAAPYLELISRKRFSIGTPEQAAAIKLSMNLQIAAVSQALTEGWHLAQKFGLSHDLFYEVLRENVAYSGLAKLKEPKLRTRDYSPQFSVKHMGKDLGLALDAAEGLSPELTKRTKEIYNAGIAAGLADLDFIALESLIKPSSDS
ncbi:MAG TPA: NAD(P)-dependent oxidoreductase [Opitutae bacterium]|nr:NAD(P)-dependent oxidoreductase [Opitutae bacterium]